MSESEINLAQVAEKIRQRAETRRTASNARRPAFTTGARVQPPTTLASPLYDLHELRAHVAACDQSRAEVGTLNPRRPGLHNKLLQAVKQIMQRLLTWYTRPLRDLHASVTLALSQTTTALANLQEKLMETRQILDRLQAGAYCELQELHAELERIQAVCAERGIATVMEDSRPPATKGPGE